MPSLVGQRADAAFRNAVPFLSALFFVLCGVVAWPLPYGGAVTPSLGLMGVYYWSLHRPDLFRPWAAFALGVLQDFLGGGPPGLSAFLFVGAHQLVLSQRRFFVGHTFLMLWAGFALLALGVAPLGWAALSLYDGHMASFVPVAIQAILSLAFFPFPAWLLIRLQRVTAPQG